MGRNNFKYHLIWICIIIKLFCCSSSSYSQITISAKIIDKNTMIGLSYASVQLENTKTGTISNEEGYFQLFVADTASNKYICFSYIGYKNITKNLNKILLDSTIRLTSIPYQLAEVDIVHYDEKYLINLIQNAIKKQRGINTFDTSARCFVKVLTSDDDNPIELIEALGQGAVNLIDGLTNIELKTGRIAYTSDDNNKFFNLDFTKILSGLSLFRKKASNYLIPPTVCNLNSNKYKKEYSFRQLTIHDNDSEKVITIKCSAKTDNSDYLNCDISIGLASQKIYSVSSYGFVNNNRIFRPLSENHSIDSFYVRITSVFKNMPNDTPYLKYMIVEYKLAYNDTNRIRHISSKLLVNLYDFQSSFFMPKIDFGLDDNDYFKLKFLRFDSVFWERNYFSVATAQEKYYRAFFTRNGMIVNFEKDIELSYSNIPSSSFIGWSIYKLIWNNINRGYPQNKQAYPSKSQSYKERQFNESLYNLDFQIFINVFQSADRTKIISETVFSKSSSFYSLEKNDVALSFINLYFDIYEIKRNDIIAKIQTQAYLSASVIDSIYYKEMSNLGLQIDKFRKDVKRGNDKIGMRLWLDFVNEKISVTPKEIVIINNP